jgi:hypothetical protein
MTTRTKIGARGLNLRALRRMLREYGATAYTQGGQWIVVTPADNEGNRHEMPLHYSITEERYALAWALERAGLVRQVPQERGDVMVLPA